MLLQVPIKLRLAFFLFISSRLGSQEWEAAHSEGLSLREDWRKGVVVVVVISE